VQGYDSAIPTVIRDSNATIVTTSNPIHRGDTVTVYLTGLGQTSPAVEAGLPSPSDPLATTLMTPRLELGGVALPVLFSGLTPGQVGVYQINTTIPRTVPVGLTIPLTITQSGTATSFNVRVVD
jgi:uncharacterized protein (TIGR03437 family)